MEDKFESLLKELMADISESMGEKEKARIAEVITDISDMYRPLPEEDQLWLLLPVCKNWLIENDWWKHFLNYASYLCPDKGCSKYDDPFFPTYGFIDWLWHVPRFFHIMRAFLRIPKDKRFGNYDLTEEQRKNITHNTGANSYIGTQHHDPNGRFFSPK